MDKPIVVLKVGTSSLIAPASGTVRMASLARVAEAIVALKDAGFHVVLVSSGAVGLGCVRLGLSAKPSTMAGKQAAAAVGQVRLMALYDDVFSVLGARVAQVLLTYDTFGERTQYLNARNTFLELLRMGAVPIVNENDTVAVQELRVGDNDTLSALVAALLGAKWLFLLTDVEALYDANPKDDASAKPLRYVNMEDIWGLRRQMVAGVAKLQVGLPASSPALDAAIVAAADTLAGGKKGGGELGKAGSAFGTGGMATKLKACQLATAAGVTTVITSTDLIERVQTTLVHAHNISSLAGTRAASAGRADDGTGLRTAATGDDAMYVAAFTRAGIGSTFLPSPKPVTGRKRWILSLATGGVVVIDDGAVAAVARGKKSLFPAGVVSVAGHFESQDAVSLQDARGQEIARALVNYSSDDIRRVAGKQSRDLVEVLGYFGSEVVADRDNIVLLVCDTPASTALVPSATP